MNIPAMTDYDPNTLTDERTHDLADVLGQLSPAEVRYVLKQLEAGRIDGGSYKPYGGSCGCMFGAVAEKRGIDMHEKLPITGQLGVAAHQLLKIEPSALFDRKAYVDPSLRPAEGLFREIDTLHTPTNSSKASAAAALLTEFILSNPEHFGD